jgi:aminocarboxymuconate-semialdehyde decarboxylase
VGSDYPFPLGESEPGKLVRSMPWPDDLKQAILFDNALSWLGLNPQLQRSVLP